MVVLDIFIGLVLIYFLYSLLASILAEMIATWIGMRARLLRQGIENILNDFKPGALKDDFLKWIKDIFITEDKNFIYTQAGKFYNEPTIKYLAKPGEQAWYSLRNRKPAYISKENFAITILNMLSRAGRGISEWDKVKFAVEENALHLEKETHTMFSDLLKRADDKYEEFAKLLMNHFDETMDRVNGWYKRKIGLIIFWLGLLLCFAMNVDSIQIVNILANDPVKRNEMVELAIKTANSEEFQKIKKTYPDSLVLDSLRAKLLEQQYQTTFSTVTNVNNILANGWNYNVVNKIVLNKQSINHCCKWCQQKFNWLVVEKRLKDIQLCHHEITDSLKILNELSKTKVELLTEENKKIFNEKLRKIKQNVTELRNKKSSLIDSLSQTLRIKFYDINNYTDSANNITIYGEIQTSVSQKVKYIIRQTIWPLQPKLFGLILTALALSLGAQFWFDLLKKLVALRGAGIKPEEAQKKEELSNRLKFRGKAITSSDPVEIAISENRKYWLSLNGVYGINPSTTNDGIEIICDKNFDKNLIGTSIYLSDYSKEIPVKFIEGEKAVLLEGHGYIHYNNIEKRGSCAGVFRNLKTKSLCALTCGHVLEISSDSSYFDALNNDVFLGEKKIGKISNLIKSSFIDAASFDLYDENELNKFNVNKIKNIITLKESLADNNGEYIVCIAYGMEKKELKCKIKNEKFDYTFKNNKYMYGMFLLEHEGEDLTQGGDSGSLVFFRKISISGTITEYAVGMVVASGVLGGKNHTLCIQIPDILKALNVEPIIN